MTGDVYFYNAFGMWKVEGLPGIFATKALALAAASSIPKKQAISAAPVRTAEDIAKDNARRTLEAQARIQAAQRLGRTVAPAKRDWKQRPPKTNAELQVMLKETQGAAYVAPPAAGWKDTRTAEQKAVSITPRVESETTRKAFDEYHKHNQGGFKAPKVLRQAAGVVTGAVEAVAKASGAVGDLLGKVPIVGAGLAGAYDLATANGAIQIAAHVASGERLDHVALSALSDHVGAIQAVAPYAQMVLSVVPVVGTGLNAGLSAGLALAAGQSITAALAAGVKAALPGGPLAQTAFELARGVIQGKPIDRLALDALPLDAKAKRAIAAGLDAAKRIARGERVDQALIAQASTAISFLPKEARAALQVGIALASGEVLQAAAAVRDLPGADAVEKAIKDTVRLKLKVPKISLPKVSLPKVPKLSLPKLPKLVAPKAPKLPPVLRTVTQALKAPTAAARAAASVVKSVNPKAAISAGAAPKLAANVAAAIKLTPKKQAAVFPLATALLAKKKPVLAAGTRQAGSPPKPMGSVVRLPTSTSTSSLPAAKGAAAVRVGWFIPTEGPNKNRIDFSQTRWAPAAPVALAVGK